jgi:thymidylate synthase (FAD)
MSKKDVLDKGYVRLVDSLGDDLSVVNAARVSYDKESPEFSDKDERLLAFLWKHQHTSPFRHAALTFEVYAPLIIARQWWKHVVASAAIDDQNGWNESSRRYITEEPAFYTPSAGEWRKAPENSKQGSGDPMVWTNSLSFGVNSWKFNNIRSYGNSWTHELERFYRHAESLYHDALDAGIAPEQARLFLPAYGMYVRWRWTVSLHGALHFISLRKHSEAQHEIQLYANAIEEFVKERFPHSYEVAING